MCGRFWLKFMPNPEELFQYLFDIPFPTFEYPPILSDHILPYNDISVIYPSVAELKMRTMFWNLIPYYEKKFEPTRTWFNIRKEKLQQPYTKNLLERRRCIIPINGFFENKKKQGKYVYHSKKVDGKRVRKKENYQLWHKDQLLMALGGLFDTWNQDEQGKRYSCTIITQEPNSLIETFHDRMPFILPNDKVKIWLDKSIDDFDFLFSLIQPYPSEKLQLKQLWPGSNQEEQFDLFE